MSWIALRGRCRTCKASIGWRYPLVELAVGGLWAFEMFRSFRPELLWTPTLVVDGFWFIFLHGVSQMVLIWFLVALAVLDAEHLWLPDRLTWLGIAMGVLARLSFFVDLMRETALNYGELPEFDPISGLGPVWAWLEPIIAAVLAAALILFIRWLYKLLRRREGLGLGDAKLMAMMGAWLGFPEALLSFVIGVLLASLVAIVLLVIPRAQRQEEWSGMKLPLGTFLCIGGIVSSFWGRPIVVAYLKWSGF